MSTSTSDSTTTIKTVDDPCPDWQKMKEAWDLVTALLGGTTGMRKEGRTYLPQEPRESDAAYDIRLRRTTLYNAFKKTVQSLVGRVFAKELTPGKDVPPVVVDTLFEDIDMMGRSIDVFARSVFFKAAAFGVSYILVEMPRKIEGATLAAERESGLRPYWVELDPQNIIGWKFSVVGGRTILTQLRIRETYYAEVGLYDVVLVRRVRVLTKLRNEEDTSYLPNVHFEVWEKEKDTWNLVDEGDLSISEIPLAAVYTGRNGFMTASPPLEDLAHMNIAHWQSSSDQRHILHVARVPILFGSGLPTETEGDDEREISPNAMLLGPEGSDLKYVEHSGSAIKSGVDDLEQIEARMRILGMEPLAQKVMTATESSSNTFEANSELMDWTQGLKDGLEQAMRFTAMYLGLGDSNGGSIQPNKDFGLTTRQTEELTLLLQAVTVGKLTVETFWVEMKRRGVLSEEFDYELEAQRLSDSAASLEGDSLGDNPEDDLIRSLTKQLAGQQSD